MRKLLHNCWEMEPQKRPGWTKTIETLKVELQLHPSCLDPPRRWHFGFLLTTEGSCSTGLLMTEGQGMLGLATFQGPLPIEEEAQEVAADWKVIVTWEAAAQECDFPIGEATLEKAIPEAVTAVRKQIAALEVAVVLRIQELTVAFKAAVTQDASLDYWVLESPAASKALEGTKQSLALLWNEYWSNVARVALYAWHKESPEACEAWQKAWKEAREAASTRKAASEAWQMAKKALHQAKMAHQNIVAA
ncbi:hypothetical protein CY35_13G052300 [Sphagnum magellanicum]|nr:hypothetical protein CY35_13G052300 [Sphagnum magellanicum]